VTVDLRTSLYVSKGRIVADGHAQSTHESFGRSSSQTTTNDLNDAFHTFCSLTVRPGNSRDSLCEDLSGAVDVSAPPATDSQLDFDREALQGQIF
jgi:hypothetical protein